MNWLHLKTVFAVNSARYGLWLGSTFVVLMFRRHGGPTEDAAREAPGGEGSAGVDIGRRRRLHLAGDGQHETHEPGDVHACHRRIPSVRCHERGFHSYPWYGVYSGLDRCYELSTTCGIIIVIIES